jgi:hypothetical protein
MVLSGFERWSAGIIRDSGGHEYVEIDFVEIVRKKTRYCMVLVDHALSMVPKSNYAAAAGDVVQMRD